MIMIYGQANLHKHHDGCSLFEQMTDVGEKQTLRSAQRKNNYQKIYKNNCKFKVSLSEIIKSTINHFLEAFELCFSVEQSLETVSNTLIGDKKNCFFGSTI